MSRRRGRDASRRVKFKVTDHAVLRYLERVHGLDVHGVRNEILTEQLMDWIDQFETGRFPIGGGLHAVVQDKTVVTISKVRRA